MPPYPDLLSFVAVGFVAGSGGLGMFFVVRGHLLLPFAARLRLPAELNSEVVLSQFPSFGRFVFAWDGDAFASVPTSHSAICRPRIPTLAADPLSDVGRLRIVRHLRDPQFGDDDRMVDAEVLNRDIDQGTLRPVGEFHRAGLQLLEKR